MPMSPGDLPLASMTPNTEVVNGAPGAMPIASRADHQHPRLRSVSRVTLDANSTAAVTYTRTFDQAPGITTAVLNNTGKAITVEVTDTIVGGVYIGCTVKGYRQQALPNVSVLLSDLSKLSGYDPSAGSAAGATISITAIQIT